ncbi:MAG: efflux RND transporter permease subunit [Gammaproteobacteria bacterium]
MSLIQYSIRNPLIINLSLLLVLIMGILAWRGLPQEMFPVFDLDQIEINTVFEGASPQEVEAQITLAIEEEFDGMADIDIMTSTSREGHSNIYIKLKPGTDVDDFIRDARTTLDRITDLPDLAEQPEMMRVKTRFPVITMTLYGEMSRSYLYDLADDTKRELMQIPGVASVGVAGDRDWELWVEVDPHRLAALGVSLDTIMKALRQNMVDQPGGSIRSGEGDILLRGKGVEPDPESMKDIILNTNSSGGSLKLGDIAKISRRFEEAETLARYNGKPTLNLTVSKTSEASSIWISDQIHNLVEELKKTLPTSVGIDLHTDTSVYLKTRLNTVKSSGLVGLVLVLISLYLFLNFRVAAITALGIPVSFLIAVILMLVFGHTINMVSLFAFLIALGMIVDDAIIVTENIYRHMELGESAESAAEVGAKEVFWPVMASTATTIAAFSPMLAVTGVMGEFIKVIPFVVCAALLGSLWEAFTVLPAHATQFLKVKKQSDQNSGWQKWRLFYRKRMQWCLLHKYLISALVIGLLAVSAKYAETRLPYEQFGDVEVGQFFVNVEAPITNSLEDSEQLAKSVEKAVLEVMQEDELRSMLTNVGISFVDFNVINFGNHLIQLIIDLEQPQPQGFIETWVSPIISLKFESEGKRKRATDLIVKDVRKAVESVAGVNHMSIVRTSAGPAGNDIEVGIVGKDIEKLSTLTDEVRSYIKRIPGVHDVKQDLEDGKLEYQYQLNERGRLLGLTQSQLADVVRSGFLGREVVHVTWNEKRLPVRVIFPEDIRESSESLLNLPIVLDNGRTVYFHEVADFKTGRGVTNIRRRDSQRLVTITADVDSNVTTPLEVSSQIDEKFTSTISDQGFELLFLGEKREADESMKGMKSAMIIALAVIFFILAALFNSIFDPFIVMFIIPFGFIGVVVGHALFDYNLQFLSMVGFLALSGIVVNDSLILVDFINKLRARGVAIEEAILQACEVRSRPIILTSITTFLGVSPLIFFATGQTKFLAPMAVSLGFGLLFTTLVILVALPCFYLIFYNIGHFFMKVKTLKQKPV